MYMVDIACHIVSSGYYVAFFFSTASLNIFLTLCLMLAMTQVISKSVV